jgi:hypothetical protein
MGSSGSAEKDFLGLWRYSAGMSLHIEPRSMAAATHERANGRWPDQSHAANLPEENAYRGP